MKVIYISGIDGCGKSTQAKLLTNNLKNKDISVEYLWLRWEPSFRRFIHLFRSKKICRHTQTHLKVSENGEQESWLQYKRKILHNPIFRKLWLTYACIDYYISYRKKWDNINTDIDIVVIDRYIYDFIIDQAINLDIPPNKTYLLEKKIFLQKFHHPDLNIIINIPALEGFLRKNDGTSLSYLEKREAYYLALTGDNTLHINGLDTIDNIQSQILDWVIKRI